MEAPEPYNQTRLIDINSTPWDVINKLPEFIRKKMQSSEEWVLREEFERGNVKNHRPKVTQEEDLSEDVPF